MGFIWKNILVCFRIFVLHIWLWVVHMRAIWDIGVKYRGWQAPYTDHCAPTPTPTNQIHYPVTTENQFWEISNAVKRRCNAWDGRSGLKLSNSGFSINISIFIQEWKSWWKRQLVDYQPLSHFHSDLRLTSPQWPCWPDWWINPDLTRICCVHTKRNTLGKKGVGKNFHTGEDPIRNVLFFSDIVWNREMVSSLLFRQYSTINALL